MLQVIVIGNVGADAQKKSVNGSEFTTFRVAHNDRWKDQSGQEHNNTVWVDCTLNGHPAVADFIKAGTQLAVIGSASLRVYSSAKDRCMKAGMQVSVRTVELLGGVTDAVPARLYDTDGQLHLVKKLYHTNVTYTPLMSQRGARFFTDKDGFVIPTDVKPEAQQAQPIERQQSDSLLDGQSHTANTESNEQGEYSGDVKSTTLMSQRGEYYAIDDHGVVCPLVVQTVADGADGYSDVSKPNSGSDGAPF